MGKSVDVFLEKFRELEDAVKTYTEYRTVLDYENSLPDGLDKEHLKMCRIARNHFTHSDKTFFEPSKKMIDFVSGTTRKLALSAGCIKDIMQSFAKYGFVRYNDTLETAAQVMGKKSITTLVVLSDDNATCGLLHSFDLCRAIGEVSSFKKAKLSGSCRFDVDFPIVDIDMPVDKIPAGPIVLVYDPKAEKYKGVIVR